MTGWTATERGRRHRLWRQRQRYPLRGSRGNDTLYGGNDVDTMIGGAASTGMDGGASADCYKFDDGHTGLGGQRDRILSFTVPANLMIPSD